jgi:hypothetical protein
MKGENLTVMGFGCSRFQGDPSSDGGIKRYKEYRYVGTTEHLCKGDSGGPVFIGRLNDLGDIIRVNSGYSSGPPLYDEHDIGADVPRFRSHIRAMMRSLEESGICYRVHVQRLGWMPPVCNGEKAGTTGAGLRIEAIQIWSNQPGISVCYRAHLQDKGWVPQGCNGEMVGTTGESRRLEAFEIEISGDSASDMNLQYQAHVAKSGWQQIVSEGQKAGTTGQSRAIEAIKIWPK